MQAKKARKLALSVAAIATVAVGATYSAYTATESSDNNTVSSGTVQIATDKAPGTTRYAVSGVKPGDTVVRCLEVENTGSLPADVKLYAASTTGAASLADNLQLNLERVTGDAPGANSECASNVVAVSNVFFDELGALPTDWATGQSLGNFTPSQKTQYRLTLTVQDEAEGEGDSVSTNYTFEARNS